MQFRRLKRNGQLRLDSCNVVEQKRAYPQIHQLRVAAYCRVSTIQDEQYGSLQAQTDYYTNLIHSRPQWRFSGIYADKTSGRCNQKMPGFQKMMAECREDRIDLILVKAVSRFGRNTLEMLQAFNELREIGIDIFFEVEGLYLKDPKAMLMLTIYASLAQEESESKSYNIRWGIRRGFEDGTSKFLNRSCYGYGINEDGDLVISFEKAKVVRQIFQWRAEGDSLRTISTKLKQYGIKAPRGGDTWSTETLSKLLKNEKYTGNVLLQKTFVANFFHGMQVKNRGQLEQYYIENSHPAIITGNTFEITRKSCRSD